MENEFDQNNVTCPAPSLVFLNQLRTLEADMYLEEMASVFSLLIVRFDIVCISSIRKIAKVSVC